MVTSSLSLSSLSTWTLTLHHPSSCLLSLSSSAPTILCLLCDPILCLLCVVNTKLLASTTQNKLCLTESLTHTERKPGRKVVLCGSHADAHAPLPSMLSLDRENSTQHRECPGDKETRCPTSSMEFSFPFLAQGCCILSFLVSLWRNFQLKQPLLGLKCAPTEASCLPCSAIAIGSMELPGDFLSPSPGPGPSHYKAPQVSHGMLAMGVHCRCLCVRDLPAPQGLGMGELERRGSGFAQ